MLAPHWMEERESVAVAPGGVPDEARLTVEANPPDATQLTIVVPAAEAVAVIDDGVSCIRKSDVPTCETVTERAADRESPPPVPTTVNGNVPEDSPADAVTVRTDEPDPPATEVGVNDAVIPIGRPVADRATADVNPFLGETETDAEPEPPAANESEFGLTETLKSPAAAADTATVALVVRVRPPPVPVIVSG